MLYGHAARCQRRGHAKLLRSSLQSCQSLASLHCATRAIRDGRSLLSASVSGFLRTRTDFLLQNLNEINHVRPISAITSIGGMFCGFLSNHIDIAPNYAGTLIAITNTFATLPGIIMPIFVGAVTHGNVSKFRYHIQSSGCIF